MRVCFAGVMLVLATATPSGAQDRPLVEQRLEVSTQPDVPEAAPKVLDKKFWALTGALNAAMLMDTKSTFDVSKICANCEEANPFVAPFVRRGPALTYTAGVLFDAGVMTIAGRMKGSERKWMRRTWWVIPVALITGHTIAYRHNVNLFK